MTSCWTFQESSDLWDNRLLAEAAVGRVQIWEYQVHLPFAFQAWCAVVVRFLDQRIGLSWEAAKAFEGVAVEAQGPCLFPRGGGGDPSSADEGFQTLGCCFQQHVVEEEDCDVHCAGLQVTQGKHVDRCHTVLWHRIVGHIFGSCARGEREEVKDHGDECYDCSFPDALSNHWWASSPNIEEGAHCGNLVQVGCELDDGQLGENEGTLAAAEGDAVDNHLHSAAFSLLSPCPILGDHSTWGVDVPMDRRDRRGEDLHAMVDTYAEIVAMELRWVERDLKLGANFDREGKDQGRGVGHGSAEKRSAKVPADPDSMDQDDAHCEVHRMENVVEEPGAGGEGFGDQQDHVMGRLFGLSDRGHGQVAGQRPWEQEEGEKKNGAEFRLGLMVGVGRYGKALKTGGD